LHKATIGMNHIASNISAIKVVENNPTYTALSVEINKLSEKLFHQRKV
jgi:hypothetical protein